MTEEQIVKAWERCSQHRECCYCNSLEECGSKRVLTVSALELINRQKSTIDELTKAYKSLKSEKNAELEQKTMDVESLTTERDALYETIAEQKAEIERLKAESEMAEGYEDALVERTKIETKKEFWKRLREKVYKIHGFEVIDVEDGDNLAKEMEGESE